MENGPSTYSNPPPSDQDSLVTVPDGLSDESLSAQPQPADSQDVIVFEQKHTLRDVIRLAGTGLLIIFVIAGGIWGLTIRNQQQARLKAGQFHTVAIPIKGLANIGAPTESPALQINGQLNVKGALVLTPTSQPSNPLTGQLFFDKQTNMLSYFNGTAIVTLGGGSTGVGNTIINNTSQVQAGPAAVLLQPSASDTQQAGNFNISGTGQVGTLKTNIIDGGSSSLYINPIGSVTPTPVAPGTPLTAGLTTIGVNQGLPTVYYGQLFQSTRVTTGNVGGIAHSITMYIVGGSAGHHAEVALYDDDGGLPSRPNVRLAVSSIVEFTPDSFNTIDIPSVALSPNTNYWLAFNTDDRYAVIPSNGEGWGSCYEGVGFGTMPNPAGFCYLSDYRFSVYVNYTSVASVSGNGGRAQVTISPSGQVLFQNSEDSANAFTVQNANSTATLLNVDTLSGRIAIGKASANFKLDISGGDANLSNGQSLRFGGMQALTASTNSTILSNLAIGGSVIAQASSFMVRNTDASRYTFIINTDGAATFTNQTDTSTAFQIQNAAGMPLLVADTSNMRLYVGAPGGSATPALLYLGNKNTAGDPIGTDGATYYNSALSSFRCFYSGFWNNCADIEPQHNYNVYDEFLSGQTSFSGQIGGLGWTAAAIGANGSLALNPTVPAPTSNRPGVLRLRTPGAANQGTTLLLGDTTGGSMLISASNDLKTTVGVGAATGQVLRVGLHSQTTGTSQPLSGVWWEADSAVDANWRYCYGDGTAATCAASTVAVTANAWVTLEIRVAATGSGTSNVYFVINNTSYQVSSVTVDTTNRVSPALSCFATGASAHDCYWDYFRLTGVSDAIR